MATKVVLPKLEMAQETATIIEWLKHEGDQVSKGEPLLMIETDKVTLELESPGPGILSCVRGKPGEELPVTTVIAYLLEPGEKLPSEAESGFTAKESRSLPRAATPVAQHTAPVGGTDASATTLTGKESQTTEADSEALLAASAHPGTGAQSSRVRATPLARRIARERGVDLSTIKGSGPRGEIEVRDIPNNVLDPAVTAPAVMQTVPLRGMRRTIAERMSKSFTTAPHISLSTRVDMAAFEAKRARLNSEAKEKGLSHVSVTAFLVAIIARVLKQHPWLNSTLRGEEIHLLSDVNLGVAVALEDGLIVPVVHHADLKSLEDIAAEVNDYSVRARHGRLTPSDVSGGTFTVSNLGPFGVEQFTAIINPPQAAILAIGAIGEEVVPGEARQVIVRPTARMTLSADHRIVDGAMAARFLADIRDRTEDPSSLLQ
jgi:pyruvate dehydrogenase E2 component (dihydrolipoamide acetyltransferase)